MVWSAIEACTNDKSHLTQLHVIPCFTVCLIIAESDCIDYQTLKWVHRWMIISPFNKGGHKGKHKTQTDCDQNPASMMYAYSHWLTLKLLMIFNSRRCHNNQIYFISLKMNYGASVELVSWSSGTLLLLWEDFSFFNYYVRKAPEVGKESNFGHVVLLWKWWNDVIFSYPCALGRVQFLWDAPRLNFIIFSTNMKKLPERATKPCWWHF